MRLRSWSYITAAVLVIFQFDAVLKTVSKIYFAIWNSFCAMCALLGKSVFKESEFLYCQHQFKSGRYDINLG